MFLDRLLRDRRFWNPKSANIDESEYRLSKLVSVIGIVICPETVLKYECSKHNKASYNASYSHVCQISLHLVFKVHETNLRGLSLCYWKWIVEKSSDTDAATIVFCFKVVCKVDSQVEIIFFETIAEFGKFWLYSRCFACQYIFVTVAEFAVNYTTFTRKVKGNIECTLSVTCSSNCV